MAEAIVQMAVRGAPAIGVTAAYGVALEAKRSKNLPEVDFRQHLTEVIRELEQTRPTAVNLFWALTKMQRVLEEISTHDSAELASELEQAAQALADQDVATNKTIGENGAGLFASPVNILTHCNTGSLATVEYGTALGVIRSLQQHHKLRGVWVDETRPYLQGARLTAYELSEEGISYQLITDNMAGHLMSRGEVDAVIVGADRIALNGDTANKIGTYSLAVLCKYHKIPFYIAAPVSTFDLALKSGAEIPIEQRSPKEVTTWFGRPLAPLDAKAHNPAFDVTPAELITAIITEVGVIEHPSTERIAAKVRGTIVGSTMVRGTMVGGTLNE